MAASEVAGLVWGLRRGSAQHGENLAANRIVFLWAPVLFLFHSTQFAATLRYFLPIIPVLALASAWFLGRRGASRASASARNTSAAFTRGFDYLLAAEYPKGGWPQFFPLREGYYSRITFNDKGAPIQREPILTELRQRIRDVRQGPDGNIYVADSGNARIPDALHSVTHGFSSQCGFLCYWNVARAGSYDRD